jgi:hypothetical protein
MQPDGGHLPQSLRQITHNSTIPTVNDESSFQPSYDRQLRRGNTWELCWSLGSVV